ncbi:MAG TPA: glycosyl hydrolase [Verrucomicrobia bacterium]|nr:glycosyl hydrolase [Verrucomicrobiota bacterium]
MNINYSIKPADLKAALDRFWPLSGDKIIRIESEYDTTRGSPVFTVEGKYGSRGWTEWTQGFQVGSALLQFDATGENRYLEIGRQGTLRHMAPHLSHTGVHDHGFNNVSTYGNLLRMMGEGLIPGNAWEQETYRLALKLSGAVQAGRWSRTAGKGGFIYSFNGPHSLFADTIRSLRSLALSHRLGHRMMGENDKPISLLERLIDHARTTAEVAVFYGEGRDAYDVCGRVAHESIFNPNDGNYRCPNSQQGYSPFSTWTRGLAWIMLGYAEELEFLATEPEEHLAALGGFAGIEAFMLKAATATCDFYIAHTAADGIPYWDTGAPGLVHLPGCYAQPAAPFNPYEPVDSSAAAIAAQGLLRLGLYLDQRGKNGTTYRQAGLSVLSTLLDEPYLSTVPGHQGLLLHSIYHRPAGWDHVPAGEKIPCGESSMWGDYHLREAALLVQRLIDKNPYYTFFNTL